MASQLEARLQRSIEGETDKTQKAELQVRLACYWARIGEFDRAEEVRSQLRQNFGDGRFARISILLMLLEGLLHYYKELGAGARDRILRANLLSSTFSIHDLSSLTSAWLAHIDFNRSHFSMMEAEIDQCLKLISHDDGEAAVRISLVLGDAFLYAGIRDRSQFWYESARVIATRMGDQATIGAITYNRAALTVQGLRINSITGTVSEQDIIWAQTELQTAATYQSLARLRSLDHLLLAADVNIKIVRSQYDSAASLALEILESKRAPIGSGEYIILICDLARCSAVVGNVDLTEKYFSEVEEDAISRLDADDKIIIYSSLSEACKLVGKFDQSEKYFECMKVAKSEYAETINKLASMLSKLADSL